MWKLEWEIKKKKHHEEWEMIETMSIWYGNIFDNNIFYGWDEIKMKLQQIDIFFFQFSLKKILHTNQLQIDILFGIVNIQFHVIRH